MSRKTTIWLGLVAVLALAGAPARAVAADPQEKQPHVAIVNGSPISSLDYEINLERFKQQYLQQGGELTDATLKELESRVLETLIGQELLYQESVREGFRADREAVNQQLEKFKQQFPSEDAFNDALKAKDITLEALTAKIEKGFAIQHLLQEKILNTVQVSPDEVKKFYDANARLFNRPEMVKASHILIKLEENADDTQRADADEKIRKVQKELADGADFAEVAKRYSEGPSAPKGGDLGFFQHGQMVPPFEKAAFALEKGGVSPKVETRFGYHIIKVTDKKPAGTMDLVEVQGRIDQHLRKLKSKEAVDSHIDKLRSEADIQQL